MRVSFDIPDGAYCLDCLHQENFCVEEIRADSLGDASTRYVRQIVAECHLFKGTIYGLSLKEMNKCAECKKHGVK